MITVLTKISYFWGSRSWS